MTIAALLTAAGRRVLSLEQSQRTVDGAAMAAQTRLMNLLLPLFPEGNVYPDTAHGNRKYPDCVYSVNDNGSQAYRGTDVSHSVLFGLSLRHPVQADLVGQFDRVAGALHPISGIEIIGYATGVEQDISTETSGNYVIGVEVLINMPVGFDDTESQLYPFVILPGKETSFEGRYDNCGTQSVLREHHVVCHASTQAELAALRQVMQQTLHFQNLPDSERPIEYLRGDTLQAEGGLLGWVDVWRDRYRMIPAKNP